MITLLLGVPAVFSKYKATQETRIYVFMITIVLDVLIYKYV